MLDPTKDLIDLLLLSRFDTLVVVILLVQFHVLIHGGILVLLVLRDQVVHVGLGFGELHLIHALAGVPMQESLATEHGSELLRDALEQFLDGGGVADEGGGHLQAAGRDVAHGGLDVVGDPFHEVAAVLVLHVLDLLLHLLHGHAAAEYGGDGEVAAVTRVAGSHHVLGVEHLLGQLGHGQGPVLLGAAGGQGSEAGHEEVETGEGDHVDGQFTQIGVQLTRETQTSCDARHGERDEVVEVTVGWGGQTQGSEADVVEGLVVDAEGLVRVLHELVD